MLAYKVNYMNMINSVKIRGKKTVKVFRKFSFFFLILNLFYF